MVRKIVRYILYLIFFGSLFLSLFYYIKYYRNQGASNKIYQELAKDTEQVKKHLHRVAKEQIKESEKKTEKKETHESQSLDFKRLQKENKDIYAWIEIPGTVINYPVLWNEKKDFYLMHNIDGSYGYPGCIFSRRKAKPLFSNPLTVLYGHNMRNGTMFGMLSKFKEKDCFEKNPYIYIYTPNDLIVYKVYSVAEWDDTDIEATFDQGVEGTSLFLKKLQRRSIYSRSNLEVKNKDIIVLSTCVGGQEKERFLVVGVKI